jgi:hypothetical protein
MTAHSLPLVGLLAFSLLGCGAGTEDNTGGNASGVGSPGVGAGSPGAGASGAGGPGTGGGFSQSSNSGVGGFESCSGTSSTAQAQLQPADIIIAIDTSGSMSEESAEVQANLNNFASLILSSGIDVHVVLIADASVCIPAPLGSGACNGADSKLEAYRHVVQTVNSTDAFQVILSSYAEWQPSLRANASKTILVVSDDESDLSASAFSSQLIATDPSFQGFKFSAIVAFSDPLACFGFSCPMNNPCCHTFGGFGCQSYAAEEGVTYQELVQQTGGIAGDLCAQEFDPIFNDMATGVIVSSQLSCDYAIPAPPEGETLDPTLVNVDYTPGGSSEQTPIFNVPGGAADCGPEGGWYYDNPSAPQNILMCPSTCSTLQADDQGTVDVVFGCKTQVVPR